MGPSRYFPFLILFACAVVACGQVRAAAAKPAGATRLVEVRVTGSTRFQQSQLVAATGLTPATAVDEAALKQAADRLASSGMFTNVTYQYEQNAQGTKVEFKVDDVAELLPVRFDNFVWMSREALLAELQRREPLFTGKVPNEGEMCDHLAEDVREILKERNVTAEVKGMPMAPQQGGSILGFLFRVDGVKLPVEQVNFSGVSAELEPVLKKVAEGPYLHSDYSESAAASFAEFDLLPQYRMRGYLKAVVEESDAELVNAETGAVAVKFTAIEGRQYKLTGIQWHGNSAVQTEELAKAITAKPGLPLDEVQLQIDLAKAQKLFGREGYLEARLQPVPTFNEAGGSVTYVFQVSEGPQYRMGTLIFEGLSEVPSEQLRSLWTLKEGAVFDSSYSNQFFQQAARQFDLRRVNVQFRDIPHRETKTVDVVIRVTPRS